MGSRTHHSTNPRPTLPEPTGPHDERFVYGLTAAGRRALEHQRRADAAAAAGPPVLRRGRISSRWRGDRRRPDLRLGGQWLADAGFGLGQRFQLEVATGHLVIRAV
jgi:hypothetical protein